MKNKNLLDDEKVFNFIHSEHHNSIFDLQSFLRKNNLPVKEKWIYYSLGKKEELKGSFIDHNELGDVKYVWPRHTPIGEEG